MREYGRAKARLIGCFSKRKFCDPQHAKQALTHVDYIDTLIPELKVMHHATLLAFTHTTIASTKKKKCMNEKKNKL